MRWALIVNGRVQEITDIDPIGRFHTSFLWLNCGNNIKERWIYANGYFAEPQPEATLTTD